MCEFRNEFVNETYRAFKRRSGAISNHGELTISAFPDHDVEWFRVDLLIVDKIILILDVVEGRKVSLYLQSSRKKEWGRYFLKLKNMVVIGDEWDVVETFKYTAGTAVLLREDSGTVSMIRSAWDRIRLKYKDD